MSPRVSKSKNIDKYPYFLPYDSPTDVPFNKIANKLGVHPNLLRGMMRSARSSSTIYTALIQMGYKDHQVPGWFARPEEPLVYRKAATAGPKANAEKRSDAEAGSLPHVGDTVHTYMVQEKSAERPSALSARSAPPAGTYSLVQLEYRPPLDPLIEEALRQIREIQNENLRDSLEWSRRRRDPPKPDSPDVIKAKVEAFKFMQQIEARNAFQLMFWMDTLHAGTVVKPADLEEFKAICNSAIEQIGVNTERHAAEDDGLFTALGELFKNLIPQSGIPDDWWQNLQAAIQEKEKSDKEALQGIAKILSENRKNKNPYLLLLEDQGKQIWDNFLKTVNPSLRPLFIV